MAWNQPGGNGGRDPWGNRGGGGQGPPDLDEVLKKLQAALGRIFGGGRSAGGGGGRGAGGDFGVGGKGIVVALVAALIGWGIWGFYIVDPPERGVVLRFGEYVRTEGPGPHWVPRPIEGVERVNVERIHQQEIGFRIAGTATSPVPHESLMLTEDENIVDLKFAVQYRVRDPEKYLFNIVDPDTTLKQATETAVREIVGRSTMDHVLTEGRAEVSTEAEQLIQSILDGYQAGLLVTSVNMQDAQPPREVQDAFFDAVKAREDNERLKNEALAYAADIVPRARGDANAILEEARAYRERVIAQADGETDRFLKVLTEYGKAPEVTRQRLYIEAVESVIGNSSKVLLDVDGSANLMYLPIDKLMGPRALTRIRPGDQYDTSGDETSDSTFTDALGKARDELRGRSRE